MVHLAKLDCIIDRFKGNLKLQDDELARFEIVFRRIDVGRF